MEELTYENQNNIGETTVFCVVDEDNDISEFKEDNNHMAKPVYHYRVAEDYGNNISAVLNWVLDVTNYADSLLLQCRRQCISLTLEI